MSTIIEVEQLTKRYQTLVAVAGISFQIEEGRCFGLLGPNGAGKTTTIEMMEGISQPSSGRILYRGKPIDASFKQEVGIQFQHTSLQDFLTVKETLVMFRRLYRKPADMDMLIEVCALSELLNRSTAKLSGGQRQRLLLAIALVNNPSIVFLDEPTTGLDPQARRNFWALIETIKNQKKTVILTTHYMEEASILCDELIIMDRGSVVASGRPAVLLQEHFDDVLVMLPQEAWTIDGEKFGLQITEANGMVTIHSANVNETLRLLVEHKISLSQLEIRTRNLEDLFLQITGKALRS